MMKNSRYEVCVICKALTEERKDTPVSLRKNYVSGCGTLCNACYLALYRKPEDFIKTEEQEKLLTATGEGAEK